MCCSPGWVCEWNASVGLRTGSRWRRCPRAGRAGARTAGTVPAGCTAHTSDGSPNDQRVVVRLRVRRYFCDRRNCSRKAFAEQVDGLTERYRRSSIGLKGWLRTIAAELGGRADERLCQRLRPAAGRTRLLDLLEAPPVPDRAPRVLGVDEFAFRKGPTYGTILVDVEAGQVVDVLPDRTSETFAARLRKHPGAEIICRDRATAYTREVKEAAPGALEVAGRWHLPQNLPAAVEKTCREGTAEPIRTDIPKLRKITSWIMRPHERLTESQEERLRQVRLACPDIARACDLARTFADLVRHQCRHFLGEWIHQAEQDAPKPMSGFAGFLRHDLDAVTAGLTVPWSSGVVEGHVNRVKTLKRAMYGRPSFRLLRTRVLVRP
ncbi:ISL3 family transposase [Streptomyces sp. SCA3-4]|uniref:ISL3 family transposase n=1 Tax=Streptomyces sichuanensis TaxID=2871810 RepID=UPI001CE2B9AF|nr:ISL3 family transposase [Streptomyces sichuanensis]MCA6091049.1 ISL3 family transposase [Streptomyces sichuanensis]